MNQTVCTIALPWTALILAIACDIRAQDNLGQASPIAGQDQDCVLVLQDGGVLVGRVARDGDRYLLTRGGGAIHIPAAGVMLVAASLDDAYRQRRQQLNSSVEGHLSLAEWCLRHDLLAHAERELIAARGLDSRHGRLVLLERRLAMASERQQKQARSGGRGAGSEDCDSPLPAPRSPLWANQSASKEQPSIFTQRAEVQSGVSDLPAGVVERFTRRVQPVLVNNCTTSGCHQPGGTEKFQLDRAILHGLANRRSTTHNLTATLELIDRQRPQLSPLLTVPRRTHGGMKGPIFGPRQEQAFGHLVEWVTLVTHSRSLQRNDPSLTADVEQAAIPQSEPDESASGVTESRYDEYAPVTESQRLQFGARLERWRPRDPFDPEIFNRQRNSQPDAARPAESTRAE